MQIGILRERQPGERRVAIVPAHLPQLVKLGLEPLVETGAGTAAGYRDADYTAKGGQIVATADAFQTAGLVVGIRLAGANRTNGDAAPTISWRAGQVAIGLTEALGEPQAIAEFAQSGAALVALELIPRITRAQSMDVLSSQATVAGYRAVLLAAFELPRLFPMLMTAAGTISAARVLILGAGVAGLQAMATSKRLGAVVSGYDIRPACREQIESIGAKYVDLKLHAEGAEAAGGYARAMDESFARQQRERLAEVVGRHDVVVCTAAIPGRRSPLLVTRQAVEQMPPGSVVVDLAAERGGNCEVTVADQRIVHNQVVVLGPTNLPAEAPYHASQMFSANLCQFLNTLVRQGELHWNLSDEIVRETLVARDGHVVQARIRELLQLAPLPAAAP